MNMRIWITKDTRAARMTTGAVTWGPTYPSVTWKITSWWWRIWEGCVCWCPNTSSLRIILIEISTYHFPDTLQISNKLLQSSQPFKIRLSVIHRRYWGALLRFPLYGRSIIPQVLGILATEGPSRVPYWELLSTMNSLTQEYTPPRAQPWPVTGWWEDAKA